MEKRIEYVNPEFRTFVLISADDVSNLGRLNVLFPKSEQVCIQLTTSDKCMVARFK